LSLEETKRDDDIVITLDNTSVIMDPQTAGTLEKSTLDYNEFEDNLKFLSKYQTKC